MQYPARPTKGKQPNGGASLVLLEDLSYETLSLDPPYLAPLAPDAPPLTFMELMSRGKSQLNAAQEYYFNDDWKDVEVAAVAIKETGNSIGALKIIAATPEQNAKLAQLSKEYMEAADQLKQAGAEKNANKTSQVFQRLSEIYRQLRIEQVKLAPSAASNPPATPPTGPKP